MKKRILGILLPTVIFSSVYGESLSHVVIDTLRTNPDILASASNRHAIDSELRQAYGSYLPQVDLALGIGKENAYNSTTISMVNDDTNFIRHEGSLQVSQQLFSGLATVNEVERNKARVASASLKVQSTAQDIALKTVNAYLEVLRRKEIVRLAERTLEAHQKVYQQIKSRSDSGVGRKADLSQAFGRLAFARSNLLSVEGALRDAQANYKRLTGQMPERLVLPTLPASAVPLTVDTAVSIALYNQPNLQAASNDVQVAKAQHKGTTAPYYPAFNLQLLASRNKNLDGVPGPNNENKAMLRMTYNLFNGGADLAKSRQAAWQVQQAAEARNSEYRHTEEETRLAWNAFMTADMETAYQRDHRDAALQTRDAYQKQFDIGQRTLLDLLDSENELFSAESSYVNSQFQALYGRYQLLSAMGTLLKEMQVNLPSEGNSQSIGFFGPALNNDHS